MTDDDSSEAGDDDGFAVDDVLPEESEGFAYRAVLAAVVFLALYFTLRFYWSLTSFLNVWLSREYVALFEALLNLALLLALAAGFVWLTKRRRADG